MGPKADQSRPRKRNTAQAKGKTASARGPSPKQASPALVAESDRSAMRIGVIADTHGYLHPAIAEIFAGVAHIIHAGDIIDPATLEVLRGIAPLTAVAGNLDTGELAASLPREVLGDAGGITFAVGHKRKRLLKRLAAGRLAPATGDAEPRLVVLWPRTRAQCRLGRGRPLPQPRHGNSARRGGRRRHRGTRRICSGWPQCDLRARAAASIARELRLVGPSGRGFRGSFEASGGRRGGVPPARAGAGCLPPGLPNAPPSRVARHWRRRTDPQFGLRPVAGRVFRSLAGSAWPSPRPCSLRVEFDQL
jgi:hypothetical protein